MIDGRDYVTATRADIRRSVHDFLYGDERVRIPATRPAGPRRHHSHHDSASSAVPTPPDTTPTSPAGRAAARSIAPGLPFPVAYPALQLAGAVQQDARGYTLRDEQGRGHHAYRIVWAQDAGLGEYYGIEGTDWTDPPIVAHPTETLQVAGRTLLLFAEGGHLRPRGLAHCPRAVLGGQLADPHRLQP